MRKGANADDYIKCLPEGDCHSVRTIKLDERLELGNNELIWFPNVPFHPLVEKSRTNLRTSSELPKPL